MSEQERKFLEVKALKKSFGNGETKQDVLKGLDFTVAKGEFCVLLGPSGSGKSTLLNILGGIDNAESSSTATDLPIWTKRVSLDTEESIWATYFRCTT